MGRPYTFDAYGVWSLVIGTLLVCAGVLLVNVTTTPQAGTGTGAGTSDEDPVATGRQR